MGKPKQEIVTIQVRCNDGSNFRIKDFKYNKDEGTVIGTLDSKPPTKEGKSPNKDYTTAVGAIMATFGFAFDESDKKK